MIEAPRGVLIHHYKVNQDGGIIWANLIVATGHNNLAIGRSVAAGDRTLRTRRKARRRYVEPCFGGRARVRPLPELLHPRIGSGGDANQSREPFRPSA